jgi:hypothetical protein
MCFCGEKIDIDGNGWTKDIAYPFSRNFSFVHPLDIVKDDDALETIEIYSSNHIIDSLF